MLIFLKKVPFTRIFDLITSLGMHGICWAVTVNSAGSDYNAT